MKKEHEEILQRHTVKLTDNLEPRRLMLYLHQKDIIKRRDREEILSKETRYEMSEALLFKLRRKGPEAFPELVKGLEENQPFLACILLREEKERLENKIAEIERERKQKEKELNKLIQELDTQLQRAEKEKKQLEEKIQELENRTSPRLRRELSHERPPQTKQYTLSYKSDFDQRGVIYYLGFQAGFNKWVNPARVSESGVEVTCSESSGDAANILEYYDPKRCSDSSWWCVDLGEKYTLRLSHYTLRQTGSDLRSFPKKWELQGRLNINDKWISLRTHRDVNWKNEPFTFISDVKRLSCKTKTWPIDGEVKAFRYFLRDV